MLSPAKPCGQDHVTKMSDHLPPDYYTPFLSRVAQERKPSPSKIQFFSSSETQEILLLAQLVRSLLPLESRPGLISLLAGKPNASTFPFTSLSFTVRSPTPSPADEPAPPVALSLSEPELAEAFQYGATAGLGALREWVEGLQEREHGRTRVGQGWRVSVGTGSQDLINKVRSDSWFCIRSRRRVPLNWVR
jgi:tryptophan aminotransferase